MFAVLMVLICAGAAYAGFRLGKAYGFDIGVDSIERSLNDDEKHMVVQAMIRQAIAEGRIIPKEE